MVQLPLSTSSPGVSFHMGFLLSLIALPTRRNMAQLPLSTSSPGVSFHTGFPYIDASPIKAGHAVLMLMQRPQSNPTAITTVVLQTPMNDLPNLLESIRHHLSLSGSEPSGIVHRPIEAPPSPIIEDTVEPIIATRVHWSFRMLRSIQLHLP